MKIMQIMPEFGLAGAEIMCENLIYGLKSLNQELIIVSFYDFHSAITKRLEDNGFKIVYLNKKKGFDFSIFLKLRKLIREEKPDVIHTHRYVMPYVIPVVMFNKKIKKIHTIHSIATKEQGKFGKFLSKIFYKLNIVVPIAISPLVKETICKVYKLKSCRVPMIFNGIDMSKSIVKDDYSFKNHIKILHIGRFAEVKNHKMIVKAFLNIIKIYPNAILQLIGDGVLKEEIIKLVKELKLQDNVEFIGLIDNVFPYLYNADIFILPSIYEGMPITLIEAMTTGLPIVATNVGGIPDMITNEENGVLIKNDINVLFDALIKFINDKELREYCGNHAKMKAKEFSSKIMADNYLQIYKN